MIIRTFLFLFFFLNGLCGAFDEDLQRSKAIALSRIHFYEIRGGLLAGTDKISMDFQDAISKQQGETQFHMMPSLSVKGTGEDLMGLLQGIMRGSVDKIAESALSNARRMNQVCREEWQMVLDKVELLQSRGKQAVSPGDFDILMTDHFSRRNLAAGCAKTVKSSKKIRQSSKTVVDDIGQIASDLKDFEQIYNLLYHHLLDALADSIEGPKKPPKGKRTGKHGAATDRKADSTVSIEPSSDAVRAAPAVEISSPLVATETAEEPAVSSIKPTAVGSDGKADEGESEEDEEDFDFNPAYFHYVQPKLPVITNPKLARKLAKEAGMAAKVLAEGGAAVGMDAPVSLPSLILKPSHRTILGNILSVASHPPKWRKALPAIRSIMNQLGGSYNGSLGNGSAVEFWISSVRFLVDGSHGGTDHEMMYPDQMVFMKNGLERAGITLDLLTTL